MKKRNGIGLTLVLLFGTLGILNLSNSYQSKKECDTVAIVTLKGESELDSKAKENVYRNFKNELLSTVGFNYRIVSNLQNIGNYVILKVNQDDVTKLKTLSSVSNVGLNHIYETTNYELENVVSTNDTSTKADPVNYSTKQMKAEASSTRGEKTLIAVLDNFFQLDHEAFKDLEESKVKFTKDEMAKVVDEKTLSATGATYYNNKIPFFFDYADNDNEVLAKSATADNTHGIHVASMAAANGDKFQGISPNAQLALMKISSDANVGNSSDATILTALNDAVAIGADVINLSFGSPIDTYIGIRDEELKSDNSTLFGAIKNLTEKGIVMSISAGNEGRGQYIKDSVQTNNYGDYCNYSLDNVEPGIIGGFAESQYGSIVASGRLEQQYDSTVGQSSEYTKKVSGFSSEGATFDMQIGIDVITPGQNVWGAVYYDKNGDEDAVRYKQMDGTSMAAPNYSGVVASVLSDLIKDDLENREEIAKTLTQRIQSTAEPLVQFNKTYYSPRKQGAGQPNIEKAINSDVYLSTENTKAKVELKNNEDIAKGHIKFDVDTHNLSSEDKKYELTMSVECPGFAGDNKEYASLMDQLIDSYTTEITIPSGDSSFSVDYTISDEAKKILEKFPNGTYIEGYAVLKPVNSDDTELSIPYMGFYGNFEEASCVEEFDFEKENKDSVTGSAILNSLYVAKGRANADFTSTIATSDKSLSGYFSKFVSGNDSLKKSGNEILVEDGKLVAGINKLSNYLVIQEVVYRNIKDNKVKLIDKDGNVVHETKLFNYNETESSNRTDGSLQKSLMLMDSNTITASKAIGEIELRNSKGELNYKAGEYTLEFDFELVYGTHQTKKYDLVIKDETASAPIIGAKSQTDDKVRINLESNVKSVTLNGTAYDVLSDGDQKYVEFSTSDFSKGKVLLEVTNEFGITTSQLFNISDLENGFSVESNLLKSTYTATLTTQVGEVDENKKFTVSYKTAIKNARGNNINEIQTYVVNVKVPSNVDITVKDGVTLADLVSVQEINLDKTVSNIDYTIHDGYLSYTTRSGNVVVTYTQGEEKEPTPAPTPDENKGNNSVVLYVLIGVGAVVVVGVIVLIVVLVRKKKNSGSKSN